MGWSNRDFAPNNSKGAPWENKTQVFLSNVFEKCDFRESKSVTYNNNVKYFQYIEVNALWIVWIMIT